LSLAPYAQFVYYWVLNFILQPAYLSYPPWRLDHGYHSQ
jgi:hypothetical protein